MRIFVDVVMAVLFIAVMATALVQEVPHEIGVAVKDIAERKDGWEVSVTIYVNKPSQKGMVIGTGGKTLKYARKAAEPATATE